MGKLIVAVAVVLNFAVVGWAAQQEFKADSKTIALWKFTYEKGSKLVKDLSGNGYDLVPMDEEKAPVEVKGRIGNALLFDENTKGLKLAGLKQNALLGEKGVTIQALIRARKPQEYYGTIAECFSYLKTGWRFHTQQKGRLELQIENTDKEVAIYEPADIFDDDWHLVEAFYSIGTGDAILRVDGSEIAKKTVILNHEWSTTEYINFSIGNGSASKPVEYWFNGEIDSLKISESARP